MSWSPENNEILIRMWVEEGQTSAAIAAVLGKTRNAVMGKISTLKLQRRAKAPPHLKEPKAKKAAPEPPQPAPEPKKTKPKSEAKKPAATPSLPATEITDLAREEAKAHWLPFLAGTEATCKYVVTNEPQTMICGDISVTGKPYCEKHCAICFRENRPPVRSTPSRRWR